MTEFSNWMPMLVTIIAIIGGSIAYRRQKRADEKSELIIKRRDTYKELLEHFHARISIKDNDQNLKKADNDLTKMTISTLLLSSDAVAIQIGEFRRMLANAIPATGDEKVEKFSKMLLEMRKDCFQESKLTEKEMSALLPLQGNTETMLRGKVK